MIRASLFFCLFSIVRLSLCSEDLKTVPECEDKTSHEIYFDLSHMGLKSIRKNFVSGPSVTCIKLAGNQISKLENGAFDGLPEINYLNLAMNPVSFANFMEMSLPKLRTLVLDGPFSEWNEAHNPSSNYYRGPYYGGPLLVDVPHISLPNLKKLSLRYFGNEGISTWLDYIDVQNLTHLYLAGNHFTDGNLPQKFTESLTLLSMDDNDVAMFVGNFPNLRYLSLDRNEIRTVCNDYCNGYSLSLRDMPNLEYLSLIGNEIATIKSDAFENLDNLLTLNVAMNKLAYLPRHLFDNLTNLKNLSLSENNLIEMPDICGLKELLMLKLNGNNIMAIDEASFCNLAHLTTIDLSNNSLTSISDGTFGQLSGLVTLDLSRNKISALPENWAGSGSVLKVLNLDGNLFTDVANMSLGLIETLEKISMGYNPLSTVTIRSLMTLPQDMKIDVSRIQD